MDTIISTLVASGYQYSEAPTAVTVRASDLSPIHARIKDMNSISILEAVNTSSVQFHGQPIITAMVAGVAYVAMRTVVENIGIDWTGQSVKLRTQREKFDCRDISMVAADGRIRKLLCIPLKKLNGWLFSINPSKVRADIRDKLIAYQEECFTVLHDYWTKGVAVRKPETTVDDRTPLRGIVNRIMGKYGMTYQAVYKLVHKEFGVNHIDELTPKQTAEAIEYLATKAIEGEFLGKQPDPANFDFEMYVHNANVVCIHLEYIRQIWKQELHPALRLIGSPLAVKLYDRIIDAGAISYAIRHGLEKASGLKGLQY
ncbi:phage antirepressor N-terminal domain-containing protein [Serratia marcescens]|uniref:phage antirepressor N-terminal domain-containing protein n=2 Tax=Serratia marcescens TaxID=615 RepID=UPI0027482835|nr:phage antirepressor N-terminal domain-containing protein [Serratia marcescens]MDP8626888.1 phage antirepressor N-terminal domain-containing protein [Serratia marcescens]MDP8676322.1 phage antirepressor N-terminal domain-containing protein [Serratia marcescens]MDP8691325.1 phage antirepressor N-terminal domain-containing protein [Serratia marcescens]MDP8700982.1 phage antirepressor N-terminal domain-containing protein [Serratia marcescens]MDP8710748.1 phage antirepressor N-terminal domain-co